MAHGRIAARPTWLVPFPVALVLSALPVVLSLWNLITRPEPLWREHFMTPVLVLAVLIGARWPRYGLLLALPVLASPLWGDTSGNNLVALLVLVPLVMTTGNAAVLIGSVVTLAIWTIVRAVLTSLRTQIDSSISGVLSAVSLILGLTARDLAGSWRRSERELHDLADRTAFVRAEQRTGLAREMHDGVAHQIKMIGHSARTGLDGGDGGLEHALDEVETHSRLALGDLRLLLGLLRDGDPEAVRADVLDSWGDRFLPTGVVASVVSHLHAAGHEPWVSVAPESDDLPPGLRQVVALTLQEATANVLAHGDPGRPCSLSVEVDDLSAVVRVSNGVAHPSVAGVDSEGWGLVGLRERVALVGGQMTAGRVGDDWVVSVHLPLYDATAPASGRAISAAGRRLGPRPAAGQAVAVSRSEDAGG